MIPEAAVEAARKLLCRIGLHDYCMVMTYFGGLEERSCAYCEKKKP